MSTSTAAPHDVLGEGSASGALFERAGDRYNPGELARGPWRPDALHGAAVSALLASAFDLPDRTPARVTFDLVAPVPCAPLTVRTSPPTGGSRVSRQTATLEHEGVVVAAAHCLAVRKVDVDLPADPAPRGDPFHDVEPPELLRARLSVAEGIGWHCFDSGAVSVRGLRSAIRDPLATSVYVNLLVPVVAGEPVPPLARAAAAADYASNHISTRLPFHRWTHLNADLTLYLSRPTQGTWVGLVSTGVLAPNGTGLSLADIYDGHGRLGHSSQALVVERRP